ncbi:hypothetical protein N431DRAFT_469710 [Stipitochalara longipes BDJ]|nr:hypothetical protein N431DRAFT_469710 [Stipitochalara longipes BDJ]
MGLRETQRLVYFKDANLGHARQKPSISNYSQRGRVERSENSNMERSIASAVVDLTVNNSVPQSKPSPCVQSGQMASATGMSRSTSSELSPPSTAVTSPLNDLEPGLLPEIPIQNLSDRLKVQEQLMHKLENNVIVPTTKVLLRTDKVQGSSENTKKREPIVQDSKDNREDDRCCDHQKQIDSLTTQIKDLKKEVVVKEVEFDRATDTCAQEINAVKVSLEKIISCLEQKVAKAEDTRKQQEIKHAFRLNAVKAERNGLKKDVSNLKSSINDLRLRQKGEALKIQKKVADSENLAKVRLAALEAAKEKAKASETKQNEISDNIRQLMQENHKLEMKNKRLETVNEDIEKQSRQHLIEDSKKIGDLSKENDKLHDKANSLEKEIETKTQELDSMNQDVQASNQQIERLETFVKQIQASFDSEKERRQRTRKRFEGRSRGSQDQS